MNAMLFNSTLVIYAAATVLYLSFLVKSKPALGRTGHIVLAVGFLVHCGFTLDRYFEAGHTPITNLHESLSFFSLSVVGIYLLCESRYKVFILGSFITPLALLILAVSATLSGTIAPLNPALQSKWLLVHTSMAFLGYAAFAISCCASIMYLIQSHFLKKRRLGPLFQKLPPLDMLDEISYRCLTFGFPLLTFAIISGAIWAETAWGTYWSWDPKEVWSLITWFIYAALLHGRMTTGWRGRKAAMLSIFGFALVLFTFLGVSYLMGGQHSFYK
jgi:cytochrome c-type biogenesis protein CcsB